MSRRNIKNHRNLSKDPKFNSKILSKFINMIMVNGKKSVAEKIAYRAIEILSNRSKKDFIESLEMSLSKVRPIVEVKSRRVGGSTYQIPVEVRSSRQDTLAMRWIINAARKRNDKSMIIRLANELYDATENKGNAVKKREEVYRMADANKAFAHYRW